MYLRAITHKRCPSGWLSKLDAMEGDQLLRACKKRQDGKDDRWSWTS
jgi:hypothetical protein